MPTATYESLYEDNTKEALQDDSVKILCTWWMNKIVAKSTVSNSAEKGRCLAKLQLLPFVSLYRNSDLETIDDANDLAEAMERQVDPVCQNAQITQFLNGNKWIVLLVDIARIFPPDDSITGQSWEDFVTTIDRTVITSTGSHLKAIATNTKNLADNAAAAKHSGTSKVEYLDHTQLPKDVKVAYLRKIEGSRIIKSDIKKFKNELTEDTRGTQQYHNFVEFPKAGWTYIIYSDGTYF